jgi:hypothetical protein
MVSMQPGVMAMLAAILFSVGFLMWFLVGLAGESRRRSTGRNDQMPATPQTSTQHVTVRYYLGNIAAEAMRKGA